MVLSFYEWFIYFFLESWGPVGLWTSGRQNPSKDPHGRDANHRRRTKEADWNWRAGLKEFKFGALFQKISNSNLALCFKIFQIQIWRSFFSKFRKLPAEKKSWSPRFVCPPKRRASKSNWSHRVKGKKRKIELIYSKFSSFYDPVVK